MRSGRAALILAIGLVLAVPAAAAAQAAPTPSYGPPRTGWIQRLTLRDGSQLVGKIVSVTDSTIQFESALGLTTIPLTSVSSVKEERQGTLHDGKYWFRSPNETRLFFGPTGRTLDKGDGYFADFYVFVGSVAYGVTDRFTIGGGLSFIPGLNADEQIWFINPKMNVIRGENTNVSVGAIVLKVPDDNGTTGLLFSAATWGHSDASVTAGIGYGFTNDKLAERPALSLGGELRLAPRASFVSENYLFPGGSNILSGGLRLFGQGLSVDLAFWKVSDSSENSPWIPFVGFLWKW